MFSVDRDRIHTQHNSEGCRPDWNQVAAAPPAHLADGVCIAKVDVLGALVYVGAAVPVPCVSKVAEAPLPVGHRHTRGLGGAGVGHTRVAAHCVR